MCTCVGWSKNLGLPSWRARVLGLLDDGMLPGGVRVRKIDSDGLWVQQGEVSLPLQELSDGYRTMVALVLDIVQKMHVRFGKIPVERVNGKLAVMLPGVILIDEIDAHLHVSWQQKVGYWLKSRFPRVQFIVTTHSPFICQAADPGGLIRLPAPGEDRKAEQVSEELFNRIKYGSVDDAVMTELFGLEHSHSDESERLREELAGLEVKVSDGAASSAEQARFDELAHIFDGSASTVIDQALRRIGR